MGATAQRRTAAAAAIMMLMTMLQFALFTANSAPAGAALGGASAFEIDGNTAGTDDWDGNSPVYGIVKTNDGGCANNAAENQIVPSTKLDDPWVVNTGQVLGKGDLCTVWTGSDVTASGDLIFLFAWLRDFNQGEVTVYVPLDGTPFGDRSGDVLVKFEFDDNTKLITVTTLRWTGSTWGNEQSLGAYVDAAISTDTKFGEAAVNLTQSGILPSTGCNRLVGAQMITETGQADANPTLKDVVDLAEPIVFNTCGAASLTVVKDVDVAGAPAIDFGFSVTGETAFTLADGGSKTFDYELDPASATLNLTVAEDAVLPDFWSFVSVACDNGFSSSNPSADVTLADGDDVTCIFTNTYAPPNPAIEIQKTPDSQAIVVGGTATFTITVTNTGDVALSNVTVTDVASPDCDRVIGDLAAGASTNYECSLANVQAGFTNVADVVGTPPVGPDVTDTDDAVVTVNAPSISIVKDADQTIVSGGTATFTITVTNTGDVALSNVSVSDVLSPDCARADLGSLAVGASTSYECSLANVTADFTNSATATGTPPVGPDVSDTDTADVTVRQPTTTTTQPSPTGSIGDYVWIDGNGDGVQDDFELPAAGVKVELLDSNGAVLQSTVSDANGGYLFDGLQAGTYQVRFTVTDTDTVDFRFTDANAVGATDDEDSDAIALPDSNVGLSGSIILGAGVDDLTVDAGVILFNVQGIQIEPTTTTTIEPVTVGTLPFTGYDVEDMVLFSIVVLAAGALLLVAVSLREEEPAEERPAASGWSNR